MFYNCNCAPTYLVTSFTDNSCTIHSDSKGIPLDWRRNYKIQKSNDPPVEQKGYAASQEIIIEDGYRYRLCSRNTTWTSVSACFYDENGKYIDFVELWDRQSTDASNRTANQVIPIPDNAVTMVIRIWYPPEASEQVAAERLSFMSLTKWQGK